MACSRAVAWGIDRILLRRDCRIWKGNRLTACSENHLLLVQDAPQRARRETGTLRELRAEAQHVVEEERSVDDSMDVEVACEKDVEKDDEEVEGTYKAGVRLILQQRWEGVVLEEDMEEGSLRREGTADGESMEEGGHGAMLWLDCKVPTTSAAEKAVAEKEAFPYSASSVLAAKPQR